MNAAQSQTRRASRLFRVLTYLQDGTLRSRFEQWRQEQKLLRRERLWQRHFATQSVLEYKLEGGAKINLYEDDHLSKLIFVTGFEENERAFIQRYLAPGDIFVDVGANIGLFTLIGARRIGRRGKVYALEPTALTYERLVQNVQRNQLTNVHCFQLALSDQTEQRMMTTSFDGYGAWNSLAQPSAGAHFRQEPIACLAWDTFAIQQALVGKVNLMKIDIEGWEFYMLQGAQATFVRSDAPDLLIEFTEVNANAAGVTGASVYELLAALGYTLYRIDAQQKTLYAAVQQAYEWENLVATKNIERVCKRSGYKHAKQ